MFFRERKRLLNKETPKELNNVETHITGSVRGCVEQLLATVKNLDINLLF